MRRFIYRLAIIELILTGANFAQALSISSLQLVQAGNAQTITTLSSGASIYLGSLPTTSLSVNANTSPSSVGSVKFVLDGSYTHTENIPPYELCGKSYPGDNSCPQLSVVGNHTLTITPYSGANNSGTVGTVTTISFKVVQSSSPSSGVVSFSLINALNGTTISGFDPIPSGAQISLSSLSTQNLSIRANTNTSSIGSVSFSLDGSYSHLENFAPYSLCGDATTSYTVCTQLNSSGNHSLTATSYSGANQSGIASSPYQLSFSIVTGGAQPTPTPASGNAGKLLSYLSNLKNGSSKRVLSGQHVEIWNGDTVSAAMVNVTPLQSSTGQSPSILGVVMNYATNSYAYDTTVEASLANQWWAKGGLVELSIYSNDPTFSFYSSGQPEPPCKGCTAAPIPASAFHQLTVTSSSAYKQWHSQLDTYAANLHSLTDSGHVVLLRPFIEINGNWNWYGAQNPADFVFVWQDMHNYLMKTKGLTNVLWVFNLNTWMSQYMQYYPGSSYVDVVGFDDYSSPSDWVSTANQGNLYQQLVQTGKPIILPEVGFSSSAYTVDNSSLITMIQNSLPDVVAFLFWGGGYSINQQNGAWNLLNNAWTVNLSQLPGGI